MTAIKRRSNTNERNQITRKRRPKTREEEKDKVVRADETERDGVGISIKWRAKSH